MYIQEVTIDRIIEAIEPLALDADDVVMLNICESADLDLEHLVLTFNALGVVFFGGVFPGIIGDGQVLRGGALLKVILARSKPLLFTGLSDKKFVLPDCLSQLPREQIGDAVVLVDGLSANISSFLSSVFNRLGNTVKYIGGGAGSLSFEQKPCLFSNEGVMQDAAIVLLTHNTITTGVKHGWTSISESFVATKTDKNAIIEINWQNAFDVYKSVVEKDSGRKITKENFFDISKRYPFGIEREGSEDVVRDPISVNEDGSLQCVGDVSENVVIEILKGNAVDLLGAAAEAAQEATKEANYSESFIVDCVSRNLFLGDAYTETLDIINRQINGDSDRVNVEGVLAIGEISTYGKGYLEFLNKTIVVGLI